MHLGADMVRDEAHDTLAIVWRQTFAGIDKTAGQPINPKPAVGIEHDLDNPSVFEPGRDCRPERSSQHACTTRYRLSPKGMNYHACPRSHRAERARRRGQ